MDGHWKPMMVWFLLEKDLRFKDLIELLPDISTKVLSEQLAELEEDKIITRHYFNEAPPRVEYSLTKYGRSLKPVLEVIKGWGFKHLQGNPRILHKDSIVWKQELKRQKA
jgi:DNA-binding HxlR family transcriptional regulator